MTTRTISIEALALRNETRARHAEQDALILQDDLLTAQKQLRELTAELDRVNAELYELKGLQDGATP